MARFKGISITAFLLWCTLILFQSVSLAAETDITSQTQINTLSSIFDRRANSTNYTLSLTNLAETDLNSPVKLVLTNISSPDVSLMNSDGTIDGSPYVAFPLGSDTLTSGATSQSGVIKFYNPKRLRFTYTFKVIGEYASELLPVELIIEMDKEIYTADDTPQITIKAKNLSDNDVEICKELSECSPIVTISKNGNQITPHTSDALIEENVETPNLLLNISPGDIDTLPKVVQNLMFFNIYSPRYDNNGSFDPRNPELGLSLLVISHDKETGLFSSKSYALEGPGEYSLTVGIKNVISVSKIFYIQ